MNRLLSIIVLGLLLAAPANASAALQIFACEPEWRSLADTLGGKQVGVYAATTAHQDPHYIRARPSMLAAMRRADLVICSGGGLEAGWLPLLLRKAGNTHTRPGGPGHLMAAELVPVLEVPAQLDRSMGDIHPEGNPHVHLNPHNIARIAEILNNRLQTLDPDHADAYQARYENFSSRWQQAIVTWEQKAAALQAMPVVVHHKSFSYLIDWLQMRQVASLEPKPGIPPTASHLETLLQQLQHQPARAILRTPYEPDEASEWLAEKTGTRALTLPYTVGGDEQSEDLFALFDSTLLKLRKVSETSSDKGTR